MRNTLGGWDWSGGASGGAATSSIEPQTVEFGTLGMMVSSDPEYLDMNANSGHITFSSDCSEIEDARLLVHGDAIGFFSGGVCEVEVEMLQNIAKSKGVMQIDFSVKHLGLDWRMSKFSMDVDWGDPEIKVDAGLSSFGQHDDQAVTLSFRTIPPNIFDDDYLLRVTILDSEGQNLGDEYCHENEYFNLSNRRDRNKRLEIGRHFGYIRHKERVCGVRIHISERDSGDVLFEKTKLIRPAKSRASTDPIHGGIWAGEEEVDFPHRVLQETGDDGYEWSADRPTMMPPEIRSRWGHELQALEFGHDPSRISVDVFGSSYEVKVPLITDVDYSVLEQSEKSCELEGEALYAPWTVSEEELNFNPDKNEVVARFLIYCPPTDHQKRDVRLTVQTHSLDSERIPLALELEPLIEMIGQPYVEGDVLYFAKGKISDEDLLMTHHGFTDETAQSLDMDFCPGCETMLWKNPDGEFQCTNSGCSENPNSDYYRGSPPGLFERKKPVEISLKEAIPPGSFHYGISTDELEYATKNDEIMLKSLEAVHSISEKVSVLRRYCNGI